jgi:hypothetical protein
VTPAILLDLIGRDLKKESITALMRLLPLLYPNNADRDNDLSDRDFPLSAEWGKGSQHYWKRVLEGRHQWDNGFVKLLRVYFLFILFYLCSGRFVVLYTC